MLCELPDAELRRRVAGAWQKLYGTALLPGQRAATPPSRCLRRLALSPTLSRKREREIGSGRAREEATRLQPGPTLLARRHATALLFEGHRLVRWLLCLVGFEEAPMTVRSLCRLFRWVGLAAVAARAVGVQRAQPRAPGAQARLDLHQDVSADDQPKRRHAVPRGRLVIDAAVAGQPAPELSQVHAALDGSTGASQHPHRRRLVGHGCRGRLDRGVRRDRRSARDFPVHAHDATARAADDLHGQSQPGAEVHPQHRRPGELHGQSGGHVLLYGPALGRRLRL